MLRTTFASLSAAVLLVGSGLATAHAAPMGPVSSGVFNQAGLNQNAYAYLGSSVPDFSSTGTGTFTLASASYSNSFGYVPAPLSPGAPVTVFTSNSKVGSTATINPSYSPFAFFFASSGSGGNGPGADQPVFLYTDGIGNDDDNGQANLAIYFDSASSTYAMFFDDGGPAGIKNGVPNDDHDYNDFVVTYQTSSTVTPEPASLALFGTGLFGVVGMVRRRFI